MEYSGELLDGKYEIVGEIGRGGMSTVYLARDIRLNKKWAVKEILMDDDCAGKNICLKGLFTEVDVIKNFDHPVLPRIVDVIYTSQSAFIVMDYIEGISLDKLIEKQGLQNPDVVVGWAKSLCGALMYLHGLNPPIIHTDMKPSNIILKPDGSIKLIDFGTAKKLSGSGNTDSYMLGTYGYAPPEQKMGIVDERSDIYSLGATLYTLLSGKIPGKPSEMISDIKRQDLRIPESLRNIIIRCVQENPGKRYSNCKELLKGLNKYKKRGEKHKVIVLSGILLTVCAIAVALTLYRMKVKEENAGKSEILMQIGMDYFEVLGDYKESARYFEQAKQLGFLDADLYKELSLALSELDMDYERLSETLTEFEENADKLSPSARKVSEYDLICDVLLKYGSEIEDGSKKLVDNADKGLIALGEIEDEKNKYYISFNQCIIAGCEKLGEDCNDYQMAKAYYGRALKCCQNILDLTADVKNTDMNEASCYDLRRAKLLKKAELLAKMSMFENACEVYEMAEEEYKDQGTDFFVNHLILLCDIEEGKTTDVEKWDGKKICDVYEKGKKISRIEEDYRWKRLEVKIKPLLERGG